MNILHLKYAVEVAKTKSISKAAENLYMGVVSDSDRFLLSYTTAKTSKS